MPMRDAAVCGACGDQQVRLQHDSADEDDQRWAAVCMACGHQPSSEVYRENRLCDLLPDEDGWPEDSGVAWSDDLPESPEGEDSAVLLVLGSREWESLASRTSLEFRYDDVDVEVVKGRGPGVGFTYEGGGVVGGVQVHVPGAALRSLHETGMFTASVGGVPDLVHLKVVRSDF
jgi:hypothetical protein